MGRETLGATRLQCLNCGFEASSERWERVDHPPLGTVTQCPECDSTDVHNPALR